MTTDTQSPQEEGRTITFSTKCIDCAFAKFSKNKQTGCSLGKLDKIPVFKKALNIENGVTFWQMSTVCQFKRDNTWRFSAQPLSDKKKAVKKETEIKLSAILVANSLSKAISMIKKCLKIENIRQILVVCNWKTKTPMEENTKIGALINNQKEYQITYPVDIVNTDEQLVDLVARKCTSPYFGVFTTGKYISKSYIQKLDKEISDMKQVVLFKNPSSINGMVISSIVNKSFGGSQDMPIYEKVKQQAEFQNNKDAVFYV